MPADRGTPVAAGKPTKPKVKLPPLAVKSPVAPGHAGYGVLATPVVPKGQLNLRSQPTAPIAHQSGPKSTPEKHTTTGSPRPVGPVILKGEHGQPITGADQARALLASRLRDQELKLNTPKPQASSDAAIITAAIGRSLADQARHAAAFAGTELGRGALDLVHAPAASVEFGEDLGKSALHDIEARAGLKGFAAQHEITEHPEKSAMATLAGQVIRPATQVVGMNGGLKALGHEFSQHPVNTFLSLSPLLGAPFRAAGAIARTGATGDAAADAAALNRAPATLIEGHPSGVDLKAQNTDTYSKNLAVKHLIQRPIERSTRMQSALLKLKAIGHRGDAVKQSIESHLNQLYAADQSRRIHREAEGVKTMVKAQPSLPEAANVLSHAVIGRLREGREADDLKAIRTKLQAAQDAIGTKANPFADDEAAAFGKQQLDDIDELLKSPQLDEALKQIKDFLPEHEARQANLDAEAISRRILTPSEAERRPLMSYAHEYMGARTPQQLTGGVHGTLWHSYREASRDVDRAERNVAAIRSMQKSPPRAVKISAEIADQAKRRSELTRQATGLKEKIVTLNKAEEGAKDEATARSFAEQRVRATQRFGEVEQELQAVHQDVLNKRIARNQIKAEKRAQLKEDRAAAEDALNEARQRREDTRMGKNEKLRGLVLKTGETPAGKPIYRELSTQEILDHMHENGVNHVAYVSAKLPRDERMARLSGAYAGGSDKGHYTAGGLEAGAWDAGYGNVAHTYLRSIQKLEQARFFNSLLREFGLGRELTHADAIQLAKDLEDTTGHRMLLMHERTQALTPEQVAEMEKAHKVGSEKDAGAYAHERVAAELNAQLAHRTASYDRKARFAVVPGHMVEHLKALQKADETHGWLDIADAFTRRFRNTVLPYSTKWLTGNVAEAALRLALEGASPRDTLFAKKMLDALKEHNPDAYRELASYTTTGLHMSFADRALLEESMRKEGELQALIGAQGRHGHSLNERNPMRNAQDSTMHRDLVRYAHKLITPHDKVRSFVYHINSEMEHNADLTALGMHMRRDMHQFTSGWVNANDAMEAWYHEFLNGRYDAEKSRQAGRYIHKVLGQYDAFGPRTKRFIRAVAPFAAWYLNAIRFIYMTMPRDHPLVTGAIAASALSPGVQNYVNPDKDLPGDEFVNGMPLGDLTEGLKTGPDQYLDVARYFPTGAFEEGPAGTIKDMVLPQYSDILQALGGKDPFLGDIKNANGTPTNQWENIQVALNDILKDVSGPASPLFNVFVGRGRTQANAGTFWNPQFKPGTATPTPGGLTNPILEGINRQFNPVRPIQLNPHSTTAAKDVGSWGTVLSQARSQQQNAAAAGAWNKILKGK